MHLRKLPEFAEQDGMENSHEKHSRGDCPETVIKKLFKGASEEIVLTSALFHINLTKLKYYIKQPNKFKSEENPRLSIEEEAEMKAAIDFMKKQPLITGLIGVLFVSLCVRYLGPRMVGNLEAGAIRLALALAASVFLYLVSREKAFEKSNNRTGYAMLVLLPTLWFPIIGCISKFVEVFKEGTPLAKGWLPAFIIVTFEYLCVGLFEEVTARGLINDSVLYQLRDSKMSTKSLFWTIAIADVVIFGAVHLIGSDFSSLSAVGMGIVKTLSSGIGGLAFLFLYWKTRNLWAISIIHGLYDYLIEFPNIIFMQAGEVVSNTQDYVNVTDSLATAALIVQVVTIVADIFILLYIWKWHMKDVDFEEIRRTW